MSEFLGCPEYVRIRQINLSVFFQVLLKVGQKSQKHRTLRHLTSVHEQFEPIKDAWCNYCVRGIEVDGSKTIVTITIVRAKAKETMTVERRPF
jgi:hypothetical protein